MKDDEAKRSVPKEDEGYDVVPLKTPVYREDLPGRPTLRDGTLHDDTRREGTRNDVQLRRTTDGCVHKETTIPNNRRTSYAYIGFIHKVHQAENAFLTIHIGTIHIVSQAPGACVKRARSTLPDETGDEARDRSHKSNRRRVTHRAAIGPTNTRHRSNTRGVNYPARNHPKLDPIFARAHLCFLNFLNVTFLMRAR